MALSHTKLTAAEVPQVNVLTNVSLVKKHTRLVAMDDVVVAKARETEKALEAQKRKDEETKAKEKKDKQHTDDTRGPPKKQRTG